MTTPDRRREPRFKMRFPVRICRDRLNLWYEGTSVNMSQTGAFIRTEDWSSFQVNDEAIVTCFLPPDFSGQDEFIGLQGKATIRRLDPVNKCLAMEFVKSFKQFERCVDDSTRMGFERKA
jgi:hypothetical protein